MPMLTGRTKWYQLSKKLLDQLKLDLVNQVSRSAVYPAAIAWDDCSCETVGGGNGLLAVSYGQIFLSDRFPEQVSEPAGFDCDAAWEVTEIAVQVIRCAPLPQGSDLAPSVEALDASAQVISADAYDMIKSVTTKLCQMRNTEIVDYMPGTLTAQGPEGACVGNEFRVWVCLPRG